MNTASNTKQKLIKLHYKRNILDYTKIIINQYDYFKYFGFLNKPHKI